VPICLEAADRLARDRIDAEVIDLRSLYPLDLETVLTSVRRTGRWWPCTRRRGTAAWRAS
jgi:pyruvate dehydrogenase E1 component beta subunit